MDRTILRNVQGRNITKGKAVQTVCTVSKLCGNCVQLCISLNKLKDDI